MKTRIWAGLIGAAALTGVLFAGKWAMLTVIVAAACIAHYEMMRAMRAMNQNPMLWPGFVFCAAMVPMQTLLGSDGLWMTAILLTMATLSVRVFSKRRTMPDAFASLASFIYPLPLFLFFVFAFSLPDPMGFTVIIAGLAQAFLVDTFSYFVGVLIGKHKLSPHISPKKTIEGVIGGFLGGILTGVALFYTQTIWGAAYPIWAYLILGLLCAFVGPIGDLVASAIKRQANIKDFGNLIPGHGGILDRVDSVLFTIPASYIFFRFIVLAVLS